MSSQQPHKPPAGLSYARAGVDTSLAGEGLRGMLAWVRRTHGFRQGLLGAPALDVGYFASVIDIGHGLGLAISTDGVGTKVMVAQQVGRFDTVGVDIVAVNVNDVLCVGAEPLALVDTISVDRADPALLEALGRGMHRGAERARVAIVGGEVAQMPDVLRSAGTGPAFDVAGTCVGAVPLDRMLAGQEVREGDVLVGLASSGIHSNGLTLARKALLESGRYTVDRYLPDLGRALGEELLEPVRIYVPEVVEMMQAGLRIKALAHISGDGLLNLRRVQAQTGYVVERLPEPPVIFRLIQEAGRVAVEEMYTTFNMGVGFCVTVDPADAERVIEAAQRHGTRAWRLGYAVADAERRVRIQPLRLVSLEGAFVKDG